MRIEVIIDNPGNRFLSDIHYPETGLLPIQAKRKMNNLLSKLDINSNKTITIRTMSPFILDLVRYFVFKNKIKNTIVHYNCPIENKNLLIKIKSNGKFDYKGENTFPVGFYDATLKEVFKINKGK